MIAFRCVVAAICAMALSPEATKEANAAIVTEIISFNAANFFEAGAPVDPVTGSFTITFDLAATSFVTGTSVVVNNLNIAGGGTPFFTYNPNDAHFGALLSVCSSVDPFPLCNVGGPHNDYVVQISNFQTTPTFSNLAYSTMSTFVVFATSTGWIEVFIVPGPIVGAGLPGLLAAIIGLVLLARRRRNRRTTGDVEGLRGSIQ